MEYNHHTWLIKKRLLGTLENKIEQLYSKVIYWFKKLTLPKFYTDIVKTFIILAFRNVCLCLNDNFLSS